MKMIGIDGLEIFTMMISDGACNFFSYSRLELKRSRHIDYCFFEYSKGGSFLTALAVYFAAVVFRRVYHRD